MKTSILASLVAFSVAIVAGSKEPITTFTDPDTGQEIRHFDCTVDRSKASAHFNATISRLHHRHGKSNLGSRAAGDLNRRATTTTPTNIPLYIHVLTKKSSAGTITSDMATKQASTLNDSYRPYGITFNLLNVTFTANDAWAVAAGNDMDTLKSSLRQGSYSALNLYFHTNLSGGILGTCTLPSQVTLNTPRALYASDGCNMDAATMPGGKLTGYNQGKTAVHETGHWLGLLHTFEGYSCAGDGDSIGDTPMQATSTNGCPTKPAKDSCPGVIGMDPVHNFMDYSTDACYTNFTPSQVDRIANMWHLYRRGF